MENSIQPSFRKKYYLTFGLLIIIISIAIFVWAQGAAPDPGHPASGIGAGTFAAGDYIMPGRLNTSSQWVNGTFSVKNTTGTQGLYQDTSSRIGIGTTAPGSKFHLQGTEANSGITGSTPGLFAISNTNGNGYVSSIDFWGNQWGPISRIGVLQTGSGSYLSLGTSNNYPVITNTAITIDPLGNVNITGGLYGSHNGCVARISSGTAQSGYATCLGVEKVSGGGCYGGFTTAIHVNCPGNSGGCDTNLNGWYCYWAASVTYTIYAICC